MIKNYIFIVSIFFACSGNAQIINFSDANFKAKLLASSASTSIAQDAALNNFAIDSNGNGEIEVAEVQNVYRLNISSSNISSISGITYFSGLQYLFMGGNQINSIDLLSGMQNLKIISANYNQIHNISLNGMNSLENLNCENNGLLTLGMSNLPNFKNLYANFNSLTSLDLTQFSNLYSVYCSANQLQSLNVSGLSQLNRLDCVQNNLQTLNLDGLTSLNYLTIAENEISAIDVSQLANLTYLELPYNNFTSLDVSTLTNLHHLSCDYNPLTSIDLSPLVNLNSLSIVATNIHSLDASNLPNLQTLNCPYNTLLESIFVKNGTYGPDCYFGNDPNLQYICADESDFSLLQYKINQYGYTNCHVNSYCSFTPGGEFYTIQGNGGFDSNNNGCDATDIDLSNLNISITNGTNTGNLISNNNGNYNIALQAGSNTITPILENPTYFNVFPASATIDFPAMASPYTQDFCVTANGVHYDLEVVLIPLNVARPGFDSNYKIIYKNKGTEVGNSTVILAFNDAVLDLVSATPPVTLQTTNSLSWDFTNLLPFETREITFTLNVNSPTEIPAVNAGDVLHYTATVLATIAEEIATDNVSQLNQTVVNSYDPNDKTCLEGNTITPSMVGEYVHYMIRFENTGTFAAQNVVIKDMIDTTKFDINTLVPQTSSHSFVTKISNTNKVEFIFENINLPFDDANNDGYVAFKIKTKPTLVVGNTFSNNASIYFDYNFPIVTNTATTTVAALGTQDFDFNTIFSLSPVPSKSVLNITLKQSVIISSVSIYNTLGQLVQVSANPNETIDVSGLHAGSYFIKISSDKGTASSTFVKE